MFKALETFLDSHGMLPKNLMKEATNLIPDAIKPAGWLKKVDRPDLGYGHETVILPRWNVAFFGIFSAALMVWFVLTANEDGLDDNPIYTPEEISIRAEIVTPNRQKIEGSDRKAKEKGKKQIRAKTPERVPPGNDRKQAMRDSPQRVTEKPKSETQPKTDFGKVPYTTFQDSFYEKMFVESKDIKEENGAIVLPMSLPSPQQLQNYAVDELPNFINTEDKLMESLSHINRERPREIDSISLASKEFISEVMQVKLDLVDGSQDEKDEEDTTHAGLENAAFITEIKFHQADNTDLAGIEMQPTTGQYPNLLAGQSDCSNGNINNQYSLTDTRITSMVNDIIDLNGKLSAIARDRIPKNIVAEQHNVFPTGNPMSCGQDLRNSSKRKINKEDSKLKCTWKPI